MPNHGKPRLQKTRLRKHASVLSAVRTVCYFSDDTRGCSAIGCRPAAVTAMFCVSTLYVMDILHLCVVDRIDCYYDDKHDQLATGERLVRLASRHTTAVFNKCDHRKFVTTLIAGLRL